MVESTFNQVNPLELEERKISPVESLKPQQQSSYENFPDMSNLSPASKAKAMMYQAFSEEVPSKQAVKNEDKKAPAKLSVNITDASHVCPLLERLCKQVSGWNATMANDPKDWRLKWVKPSMDNQEIVDILNCEPGNKMINRYPDCQVLAHKEMFAQMMRHAQIHNADAFKFIPPSFELPSKSEAIRLDKYMADHSKATFIAKPQVGAQGDGIALFRDFKDLPYGLMDHKDLLIQRYLDKPLLLDGIKFDLRVYVVVVGLNPLQAYICDEGLARFCTVKYEAPTKSNFKKAFMHLTNYSINKMSDDYVKAEEGDILLENEGTKRTLSSLYKSLEAAGVDVQTLQESIVETCSRTMQVYGPMMQHQCFSFAGGKEIGGTPFQILGFDLLIDEKLKAWVLEINDHPSLNIFFEKEFMGTKKPTDEDICNVDMYVKTRLVADVVTLCRKSAEKRQEIEEFGSLSKILPNDGDEEACAYHELLQKQRSLFYQLATIRNKAQITPSLFEKLASKNCIKKMEIQKIEFSLVFQAATGNAKMVDFLTFCEVLAKFYEMKVEPKGKYGAYEEFLDALMA